MATPAVNVEDARGLSFSCLPECGFCCTASPLVLPHEEAALGARVVRAEDGTLRIPVRQGGVACGSLQADARCGNYDARPAVCRVYPFQAHAGRRVQVVVTLACPGVAHAETSLEGDARDIGAFVLKQPGAAETAERARATFAEYDRRMREWNVAATPDRLRSGFGPHLARLALPSSLPAFFAGLAPGDLVLDGKAARAVEALFDAVPEATLDALLWDAARDAFAENEDALWVEADFAWAIPMWRDDVVELRRTRASSGASAEPLRVDPREIAALEWTDDACAVVADYLARLTRRDHTEGAAAWLVDASGYQATPAAAYGRVLAEAALQVVLRAGLAAVEAGSGVIDAPTAARGVRSYETSYHSLPTIGGIL